MQACHRRGSRTGWLLAAAVLAAVGAWTGPAQAGPGDAPVSALGRVSAAQRPASEQWTRSHELRLSMPAPRLASDESARFSLTLNEASLLPLRTPLSPAGVPGLSTPTPARIALGTGALASQGSDGWGPWQEPSSPGPGMRWGASAQTQQRERGDKHGTDKRSRWARWNSSLWGVSATMGLFAFSMVGAFTALPAEVTGWESPKFEGLKGNFTQGPRFDNDKAYFNYVAHPLAGSEYYLAARNRGCTWWQSLAYSAAASGVFEFFVESAYERASWQDLWITPVSGAVLGELRWQLKKAIESPTEGKPIGTLNKILYVVVDPMDAVYKL